MLGILILQKNMQKEFKKLKKKIAEKLDYDGIEFHVQEKDFFFFYLGFLSRTFTIHGTAGEGGGYLFNSSLPLPPASQTIRH